MTPAGMTTGMLDALMQLFAIFAAGGSGREAMWGRQAASRYLRGRLAKSTSDQYLIKYDSILNRFNTRQSEGNCEKQLARLSVKLMRTCAEINRELELRERMVVYARLAEFTTATGQPTDSESFLLNVAEALHLPVEVRERVDRLVCSVDALGRCADGDEGIHKIPLGSGPDEIWAVRSHEEDLFFIAWKGAEGATLNSVPLMPGVVMPFSPGSVVKSRTGESLFFSELARLIHHAGPQESLTLGAHQLSHKFLSPPTTALHPLDFQVEGGMLVGLMGASGSGKSTLLNLLNGNIRPSSGQVILNGIDLHTEPERVKGVLGYVAQEDVLFSELTVEENLRYAASLSDRNAENEAIASRVEHTLRRLGLWQVKDLRVGSVLDKTISGGQRKRLNIALELIRSPRVLFVDEPTSGLSSRDSEHIMDLLKELTHRGTLVIVVIHQPSSDIFKLFDHLLILDTGGFPVYQGHPMDSLSYFKALSSDVSAAETTCVSCGHVNPEQVFNILEGRMVDEWGHLTDIRKVSPEEWHEAYRAQLAPNFTQNPTKSTEKYEESEKFTPPTWGQQLRIFLSRDLKAKSKNRSYLLLNLLEAPVLAGLLAMFLRFAEPGAEYAFEMSENLPQFLFIAVIVALFIGLSLSAEEIIRDRAILRRERFLHLNWRAYVVSKIAVMWGWTALSSLTFVAVAASILELRDALGWMFLSLFSLGAFANLLGLLISSVMNSVKVIYITIPLLIIPQIIFGGAIVRFDRFNPLFLGDRAVPWIGEMMASRWGFEALAVQLGRQNAFDAPFLSLDDRIERAAWRRDFWYEAVNDLPDSAVQEAEWNRARAELAEWGWSNLATPEEIRNAYREEAKSGFRRRDSLRSQMDNYLDLRSAHRNETLRDWLMQTDRTERFRVTENGVLPLGTMAYQTPKHLAPSSGGVGFYQPQKLLFGHLVPTPIFNIGVLWTMSMGLMLLLAFQDKAPRIQESLKGILWRSGGKASR